jgi:hypothetical protein
MAPIKRTEARCSGASGLLVLGFLTATASLFGGTHASGFVDERGARASLFKTADLGLPELYNGTQITTINGGACIAIKIPAGKLTYNTVCDIMHKVVATPCSSEGGGSTMHKVAAVPCLKWQQYHA